MATTNVYWQVNRNEEQQYELEIWKVFVAVSRTCRLKSNLSLCCHQ